MSIDAWVTYDLLGQARKLLCERVRAAVWCKARAVRDA